MTDTQNELIRWAAKYVGWKDHGPYGRTDFTYRDECWYPEQNRTDLHALVGLVEDKVREGHPIMIMTCTLRNGMNHVSVDVVASDGIEIFDHDDPLIARLGALKQLVEKIE